MLPHIAGVEAALTAMQRGQEAVVWCPVDQLRGGVLLPDPPVRPAAGGGGGGAAAPAPDYAEITLQLRDFTQVPVWRGPFMQGGPAALLTGWHRGWGSASADSR